MENWKNLFSFPRDHLDSLIFCSLLNAILINTKCKIDILPFLIHDSCNNIIFAFLTAYFNIVCMTFVDRLQLCCKTHNYAALKFFCISKFNEFDVLDMYIYQYFLRSILMRSILRMKHLLHDVFCRNSNILNQYANIFNLICRFIFITSISVYNWNYYDIVLCLQRTHSTNVFIQSLYFAAVSVSVAFSRYIFRIILLFGL